MPITSHRRKEDKTDNIVENNMTRIFIVDDDAHLLLALKAGLSRKGYDISTFDNKP